MNLHDEHVKRWEVWSRKVERCRAYRRQKAAEEGREITKAWRRRGNDHLPYHMKPGAREQRNEWKRQKRAEAGAKPRLHEAHVRAWASRGAAQAKALSQPHDQHVKAWSKARPAQAFVHKYRTDAEFNAKQKLRARLRKMATLDGKLAAYMSNNLKKGGMWKAWTALLGYDSKALVAHLQRTLPKGATWDDFLSGAMHIDHIIPRAAFDLTQEADVRECWSLSNLRLLWARDNQRKAARVETLC